jgi:hypothetical protein
MRTLPLARVLCVSVLITRTSRWYSKDSMEILALQYQVPTNATRKQMRELRQESAEGERSVRRGVTRVVVDGMARVAVAHGVNLAARVPPLAVAGLDILRHLCKATRAMSWS